MGLVFIFVASVDIVIGGCLQNATLDDIEQVEQLIEHDIAFDDCIDLP